MSHEIPSLKPEVLPEEVKATSHEDLVYRLVLAGHTKLAADHLLHREMKGLLMRVVGDVVRKLNLVVRRASCYWDEKGVVDWFRAYEFMLQLYFNLIGAEVKWVGFTEGEVEETIKLIHTTLSEWEQLERKINPELQIARSVVEFLLEDMARPMSVYYRPPGSMLSKMSARIKEKVREGEIMVSFLNASKEEFHSNVYYRYTMAGVGKFGNDYALGLRWLRHLGFVQVSTNPVLAACAYDDDPTLWEGYEGESFCPDFMTVAKKARDPDELTMLATEVSVFPNLAVFRPIFIASDYRHGLVSYQLNPYVADSVEASVRDAIKIYSDATEFLLKYDNYLLWGYSPQIERGRPNLVFKVPGNNPAAIKITAELESLGIGTNNTETYSVSQETYLILAKMEGRAKAVKRGTRLTTVYETTMVGRLDDHLRETQAEILLRRALQVLGEATLDELLKELGAGTEGSFDEKVLRACDRKFLKSLNLPAFVKVLERAGLGSREELEKKLRVMEDDITHAGIIVTKRVYQIFFSHENRSKWILYLCKKYGLTKEQAEEVISGIDMLPASKRKPRETFLTLSSHHVTNTEFPNFQSLVIEKATAPGSDPFMFRESISWPVASDIIDRLMKYEIAEECKKVFELTPELDAVLREAGVRVDFGLGGMRPEEWPSFGAVMKTRKEFKQAYENLKQQVLQRLS